jgi:DNA-binding LacI/PurR family transcriptional regulator
MLELGHKRIAFVTREMVENSEDRITGYGQALVEAGIPLDAHLIVRTELAAGTAYQAVNRLLSLPDPPTAVICLNDPVAIECQQAVLDRGLRVPADVAIGGADNMRDSLAANPPITTMHPPLAQIGRLATKALLAQVADPGKPATKIELPVELVIRQSTTG